MQFIKAEEMKQFTDLGYTFTSKYTPNNLGTTYNLIVTDKEGNEVVHTQCSYANASGHGYAMCGAERHAVSELQALINGEVEEEVEYDTDFLNILAEKMYITDYGYTKDGELLILFDSWDEVEGESHYEDEYDEDGNCKGFHNVIDKPSVYHKLVELAKKDLLKPSINKTIKEVEYVFSDSYGFCAHCHKLINREWEGLTYLEDSCEELCDDCINENTETFKELIEQAKNDFDKALPVTVSEDKIKKLGYVPISTENFSTRCMWGEESWSCHNIHPKVVEQVCQKVNGFAKLTHVSMFESEYQIYVPAKNLKRVYNEFRKLGIDFEAEIRELQGV